MCTLCKCLGLRFPNLSRTLNPAGAGGTHLAYTGLYPEPCDQPYWFLGLGRPRKPHHQPQRSCRLLLVATCHAGVRAMQPRQRYRRRFFSIAIAQQSFAFSGANPA